MQVGADAAGEAVPDHHGVSATAAQALDGAAVQWALLRDDEPSGRDVDVLVSPRQHTAVASALSRAGFVEASHWAPATHRAWYLPSRPLCKLDVVTDLAFGEWRELRTWVAEACLYRQRPHQGMPRLAPDDDYWALLLHHLLDRDPALPRTRRERLLTLAASAGPEGLTEGPLAAAVRRRCGLDAMLDAADAVRRGDEQRLAAAGAALKQAWVRSDPVRIRSRVLLTRLRRKALHLGLLPGRSGLTIAILGSDGAGKTTLAAAFAKRFPLPVHVAYLGFGGVAEPRHRYPGRTLLPKLQSIGPATVRAALHRRRGELVILDRYGDDFAEADGVGLKRRLARSTIGALLGLVNPDLVIVLDAPAAVMHQRKGEHTPEELAHRRRHYLELAKRRAGVAVIDATAPPDQVLATASTQVWRRWSSRTSA